MIIIRRKTIEHLSRKKNVLNAQASHTHNNNRQRLSCSSNFVMIMCENGICSRNRLLILLLFSFLNFIPRKMDRKKNCNFIQNTCFALTNANERKINCTVIIIWAKMITHVILCEHHITRFKIIKIFVKFAPIGCR